MIQKSSLLENLTLSQRRWRRTFHAGARPRCQSWFKLEVPLRVRAYMAGNRSLARRRGDNHAEHAPTRAAERKGGFWPPATEQYNSVTDFAGTLLEILPWDAGSEAPATSLLTPPTLPEACLRNDLDYSARRRIDQHGRIVNNSVLVARNTVFRGTGRSVTPSAGRMSPTTTCGCSAQV